MPTTELAPVFIALSKPKAIHRKNIDLDRITDGMAHSRWRTEELKVHNLPNDTENSPMKAVTEICTGGNNGRGVCLAFEIAGHRKQLYLSSLVCHPGDLGFNKHQKWVAPGVDPADLTLALWTSAGWNPSALTSTNLAPRPSSHAVRPMIEAP